MYPFDTQVCQMIIQVNGIPKNYIALGVQTPMGCDTCDGATYKGNRQLVEYIIGESECSWPETNTHHQATV